MGGYFEVCEKPMMCEGTDDGGAIWEHHIAGIGGARGRRAIWGSRRVDLEQNDEKGIEEEIGRRAERRRGHNSSWNDS